MRAWVWAIALSGCVGAAAEHEVLGDRAYAEARYADALVEYQLAVLRHPDRADLRAKAGAAALHAEQLREAVDAYLALSRLSGEERRGEAASGLMRVADRALEEGDQEALGAALVGLREITPEWALGGHARILVGLQPAAPRSTEGLALLRIAAAGSANARTQDSLMLVYAAALRVMGDCERASRVYESLVRRERDPKTAEAAREGEVVCALELGRRALEAGRPAEAEQWFRRAGAAGGDLAAGRAAYIGLGDVLFAQGDFVGAAEAYLRALEGLAPGDSLYAVASERLNAIANAGRVIP